MNRSATRLAACLCVAACSLFAACDVIAPSNPFDPDTPPDARAKASIKGTVRLDDGSDATTRAGLLGALTAPASAT